MCIRSEGVGAVYSFDATSQCRGGGEASNSLMGKSSRSGKGNFPLILGLYVAGVSPEWGATPE
jgi:hypothetical protein